MKKTRIPIKEDKQYDEYQNICFGCNSASSNTITRILVTSKNKRMRNDNPTKNKDNGVDSK